MNDQYIVPLFVAGSMLLALLAFFLIAVLLVQKNKQNAYQLEKRQMVFDHQSKILTTKIEEQENILDQISKELHDNVKSVLGFAQMKMYDIAELATDPRQTILIDNTQKIIDGVIEELHKLSHSFNSNFVKHIGLVETITKEMENIRSSKNIACDVVVNGGPISLSAEKELHIYRIAQEAIQNAIKHAKATRIIFTVESRPNSFMMKITDNGTGFDKNEIYEMKGLGFLNMFQRARYVHGLLEVQSAPLQGSSIVLTLNPNEDGASD